MVCGDNGGSRKHGGNQGRWNFPCIIKKGLVCSLRSWEAWLVNPTKVLRLRTPWDEGHPGSSANPPLILHAPLYRYTLSPLTTSSSNLGRFRWVKQVSDPWAHQFPSSVLPSLHGDKFSYRSCQQPNTCKIRFSYELKCKPQTWWVFESKEK